MASQPSLLGRAIAALALMIGFYALALALVVALAALPYVVPNVPMRLVVVAWIAAFVIVVSIVPRPDFFVPPGPRIDLATEPRLATVLDDIARATEQPMPREVYLVYDANAFVTRRGGVMGFFSRPVMGLGLALLATLSEDEMRAVIAHEFGHFHGGDTRIGPWIYKTRAAVIRTVVNLHASGARWLHWPFRWYGEMFLRITQAISRRQELAADALAARVVSPQALGSGLQRVVLAAVGMDTFAREYDIALRSGLRLPFATGFTSMLKSPEVAPNLAEAVEEQIATQRNDPYDTHPPMRERIAALGAKVEARGSGSEARAIDWFRNVNELETALLWSVMGAEPVSKLRDALWEETGEQLWLPLWTERCREHGRFVSGATFGELPELARKLPELGEKIVGPRDGNERVAMASGLLASALGLALHRRGFHATCDPGGELTLVRGELRLRPSSIVRGLAQDPSALESWKRTCAELELGDELLIPAAESGAQRK